MLLISFFNEIFLISTFGVKCIITNAFIFMLGFWGLFVTRKNIIVVLMSIELMLLAINLNFLYFSLLLDDIMGIIASLLILTVAAAEAAIGLAIVISYYRLKGLLYVDMVNLLKG